MGDLFEAIGLKPRDVKQPKPPDPAEASRQAREVQRRAQRSQQARLRRQRGRTIRGQLSAPGLLDLF